MRVLVTSNHTNITGVNTFLYTFIATLKKEIKDIEIDFYVPFSNYTPSHFEDYLEQYIANFFIVYPQESDYDYIYYSYKSNIEFRKDTFAKKGFFVHGLMNPDYAIKDDMNIDKSFVFGERSMKHTEHKDKVLIRNFVDLKRFKPVKLNKELHTVAIFRPRNRDVGYINLKQACKQLGLCLKVIGGIEDCFGNVANWNVEKDLREADLVVATGRCMHEAMAMGIPVINGGLFPSEGYIDSEKKFLEGLETNSSGWITRALKPLNEASVDDIVKELSKWKHSDGALMRKCAEKHLNPASFIKKILF